MQNIAQCLWFDGRAEEAAKFYTSVFKNAKLGDTTYYGEAGPLPKGTVLTVTFELNGQEFMALNGGPQFQFTPAISLFVKCDTQEEVDYLWEKLTAGGQEVQCGWLTDKFGISWQIVPVALGKLLKDNDAKRNKSLMEAMFKMKKLDIKTLEEAYNQA